MLGERTLLPLRVLVHQRDAVFGGGEGRGASFIVLMMCMFSSVWFLFCSALLAW